MKYSNDFKFNQDCEDWTIELRKQARMGWSEWLQQMPWQYRATFTFESEIHPEQAYKRCKRWMIYQNQKIYGKRYRRYHKGLTYCIGIEYQKRGVIHFHILLNGLNDEWDRYKGMGGWKKIGGGWAKIYKYEDKKKACDYISKYVSKGGELDLYIGDRELKKQIKLNFNRSLC